MTTPDISGQENWRRSRIVVPVPSPAAGADWSFPVPAGHLYQLVAVSGQLVTSATVATRAVRLTLSDGTAVFLRLPASATQVASLTRQYSWWDKGQVLAVGSDIAAPLPGISMPAGWVIASATDLIDGTDAWTNVKLHVIDTTVRAGGVDIDSLPDLIVEIVEAGH